MSFFRVWVRLLLSSFLLIAGCSTGPPPTEEYTLAKVALDAAKAVEAGRHSPGYYHQAEEAYRNAKVLYQDREYEQARLLFIKSRLAAEKAENSARLIRFKSGEVL